MIRLDVIFTMMAYLPVMAGIVGFLSILVYVYMLAKKKPKRHAFLVIGCICIGVYLLIVCSLFLAGALGLGPKPT